MEDDLRQFLRPFGRTVTEFFFYWFVWTSKVRSFLTFSTFSYHYILPVPEGGGDLSSYLNVAHEFKEWYNALTRAKVDDPDEWDEYVKAFMCKLLPAACGALNARVNMTIHYGIGGSKGEDGKIIGVPVDDQALVIKKL